MNQDDIDRAADDGFDLTTAEGIAGFHLSNMQANALRAVTEAAEAVERCLHELANRRELLAQAELHQLATSQITESWATRADGRDGRSYPVYAMGEPNGMIRIYGDEPIGLTTMQALLTVVQHRILTGSMPTEETVRVAGHVVSWTPARRPKKHRK